MNKSNNQKCEWSNCKALATQADTYQNMWLCDNHYSELGNLTGDYQDRCIDYEDLQMQRIIELIERSNNDNN